MTTGKAEGWLWADYDNDGDLDVYIGMYHDGATGLSENILLNNDGTGFFDDVTAEAGVGNGLKHTFQATWYDFDADSDLDLWVVNDRGGVSPTPSMRIWAMEPLKTWPQVWVPIKPSGE